MRARGGCDEAARTAIEAKVRAHHQAGRLREAATAALEGYGPEVLGFLIVTLRSETDAAEAFAQFCADLWTSIANFGWRCSFRTWAYTVARHAGERQRRDRHARRAVSLEDWPELSSIEQRVRTATEPFCRTETKARARALRD